MSAPPALLATRKGEPASSGGPEACAQPRPGQAPSLRFTVDGDPVPWERVRTRDGRHFTATRTRNWQDRVKVAAGLAGAGDAPLTLNPVRIRLDFFRASAHHCDWDNLAKSVCDALNGVAYEDDHQITDARVVKGIDRVRPRVEVEIGPIPSSSEGLTDISARVPEQTRRDLGALARALNPKRALRSSVRRYR